MNPVLTIDPEFEAKCPPLTEDELSQLEENILEEGLVLMPLIVWNDTIGRSQPLPHRAGASGHRVPCP